MSVESTQGLSITDMAGEIPALDPQIGNFEAHLYELIRWPNSSNAAVHGQWDIHEFAKQDFYKNLRLLRIKAVDKYKNSRSLEQRGF